MQAIQAIIEAAYEQRATLNPSNISSDIKSTLNKIKESLDKGLLRVAEKRSNTWIINTWIKKAILLMFRANNFAVINANFCQFYDKLPLKFNNYTKEDFEALQTRVVPTAIVRYGAYIGPNTILMPSYVNIGAYIDSGAMIDTWATVGSCAQIGKNVHLSGGVGIGGVLEPLQASPTIIEDNCFIGARSEIVEGVIVEEGSVISMGVFIGQSTKIYNRITGEISYGRIPKGSVVVPGSLPSKDGTHQLSAAIIIKQVDAQTREKIGINALLRQD